MLFLLCLNTASLTQNRQYHKTLCKSYADFTQRPGDNVRLAILLPEDGDKPHFIWLPVKTKDKLGSTIQDTYATHPAHPSHDFGVPDRDEQPGSCTPTNPNPTGDAGRDSGILVLVCNKLRSGELLDHSITMLFRRNKHKYRPNQCLKKLVKKNFDAAMFRGPLIICAMSKVKIPMFTYDIDTSSLTLALDAIIGVAPPGVKAEHTKKINAVRANSAPPYLETIQVPKRHPIFKTGKTSEISRVMGMSLVTWTYPTGTTAEASPSSSSAAPNTTTAPAPPPSDAKVLHLDLDPTSPNFRYVPQSIQADNRRMLIARSGGMGLDASHCADLLKCFEEKIVPVVRQVPGSPAERYAALKKILQTAGP